MTTTRAAVTVSEFVLCTVFLAFSPATGEFDPFSPLEPSNPRAHTGSADDAPLAAANQSALSQPVPTLEVGDMIVADIGTIAIYHVDPTTGFRTVISSGDVTSLCQGAGSPYTCCTGNGMSNGMFPCMSVGSGPAFERPVDVAVDASRMLFVTDSFRQEVLRVDPVTGERTVVSSALRGMGDAFITPAGIATTEDGQLLVVDYGLDAVLTVDPVTGDRGHVSSATEGTGPVFGQPFAIVAPPFGDILIADFGLQAVLKVDPATGDREIVSGAGVGSGPAFALPLGVAALRNSDLLVAAVSPPFDSSIVHVDPSDGERTIVSSSAEGSGTSFVGVRTLDLDLAGDLIVADHNFPAVFRVVLADGAREVVSSCVSGCADPKGGGPDFYFATSVTLVPQSPDSVSLPVGANVAVSLMGGASVAGGIDLLFENVTVAGTLSATIDYVPLSELATVLSAPADVDFRLELLLFHLLDIDFDGAFSGEVSVTLGYDDTVLAPGCLEDDLEAYHEVGTVWQLATGPGGGSQIVDTVANTVLFATTSFSPFALGGPRVHPSADWEFTGTADGGSVDFAVGAVLLQVVTSPGESAAHVASNIAAAINADPTLSSAGIGANANDNVVSTNGPITFSQLNDPGLSDLPVPLVFALHGGYLMALGLVLAATALIHMRRTAPIA